MSLCILSTANDLYLAGENHRCENKAYYRIPGELGEYLVGGLICKEHVRYVLKHPDWAEQFLKVLKQLHAPKGENVQALQELRRQQAIWSELS